MNTIRGIVQFFKDISFIDDVANLFGSVTDLELLDDLDCEQCLVLQVTH